LRNEEKAVRNEETAVKSLALTMASERNFIIQVQDELRRRPELRDLREKLLRGALGDLEKVRQFSIKNPLMVRTDAAAMVHLGSIFLDSGRVADAAELYESAHAALAGEAGKAPDDPVAKRNLAAVTNALGDVALRLGDAAKARDRYQSALDLRKQWAA